MGEKSASPLRAGPPAVAQSDTIRGDTRLPLKYRFAFGLLVIGAVGIPLRLSPLGMGDFARFSYRKPG